MRKTAILGSIFVIALAVTTGVVACDKANAAAEAAYTQAFDESGCSKTATKAAYDAVYGKTGCSKTADAAAQHAVAQAAYNETLKETDCEKTAKAAYDASIKKTGSSCAYDATRAVNDGSSCAKSSAKAAYAETLEKTGCSKTAQEASDKAGKTVDGMKLASNEEETL